MYNREMPKYKYSLRIPMELLEYCQVGAQKVDMTVTDFVIHSIRLGAPLLIERLSSNLKADEDNCPVTEMTKDS